MAKKHLNKELQNMSVEELQRINSQLQTDDYISFDSDGDGGRTTTRQQSQEGHCKKGYTWNGTECVPYGPQSIVYDGLILFAPVYGSDNNDAIYLMDKQNNFVHLWDHRGNNFKPDQLLI